MSDKEIICEKHGGILHVTLNRPEARNALTFAMYEGLAEACAGAERAKGVSAVIVRGAGGKAFAAGTDMAQFRSFSVPEDAWAYEEKMDAILATIESCRVPTIAAIEGACTGGGAAIAVACDLRIATPSLKFGFPIARTLGNCLSAANLARLSDLAGAGRVREILLTARLLDADEARVAGFVHEVVEGAEALHERARGLAEQLAGHAPLTIQATKEALRRNRAARVAEDKDLIELCYMSSDFREGMEAFLAKRRPEWKGR